MTTAQRLLMSVGASGSFTVPMDEEFNGANTNWTLTGTNLPDFGVTTAGKLRMPSGSVAHRARIPAFPFTMTAFCSYILYDNINTVYANATLAVGEATPAGSPGPIFWGLEWDVDVLGSICVFDGRFANFAATPTHLSTKTNETAGLSRQVPHYQRMIANSATSYDLQWSLDGTSWTTYATALNPTLTAGAVMLVSFGCITEWDWVRFS